MIATRTTFLVFVFNTLLHTVLCHKLPLLHVIYDCIVILCYTLDATANDNDDDDGNNDVCLFFFQKFIGKVD